MLSSRTHGGRDLPQYYLVYFLLIDFLGFPSMGKWEKSAWTIPIRYRGKLYGIEHRKMGLGVFAPNLDPLAMKSGSPSTEAEVDAKEITTLIIKAVSVAEPYFKWRAEQAASTSLFNVLNKSDPLFERYEFFCNRFKTLSDEAQKKGVDRMIAGDKTTVMPKKLSIYIKQKEATWNAQAAIDAFFSWTEHVFIHLAILQSKIKSGDSVAILAKSDWNSKFKAALNLTDSETKEHYDRLLDIRTQIRNFMTHGAFGKKGEAFQFHSGAGSVPVLLTESQKNRYSLNGKSAFDEQSAIAAIEQFIGFLWSDSRLPAQHYILSSLPSILTLAEDGTYTKCMESEDKMKALVERLTYEFDNAGNMDW